MAAFAVGAAALTASVWSAPAQTDASRAYLKCQQTLERYADSHRERADKLDAKYERRLEQRIGRMAGKAGSGFDRASLTAAAERIREWRDVEQARAIYVDKIIEDVTQLIDPDGPDFRCLDQGRVLKVYLGNLEAYERVLEELEGDLEEYVELTALEPDEGLVIISFAANEKTTSARINRRDAVGGNIEFSPLRPGQFFRVFKAKAGSYTWDLVSRDLGYSRLDYRLKRFDLDFVVEPGKVNYSGTLLLEVTSAGYYKVWLNDRPTIALLMLEQNYPELMQRFDIVNGLYPDDRFTEFYLSEKATYENGEAEAGD